MKKAKHINYALRFTVQAISLVVVLYVLSVSDVGLKAADLEWKPNPWDITIYSSLNRDLPAYLIPNRLLWVPLYLLPPQPYEELSMPILVTFPYWLIISSLVSGLVVVVTKRFTKPPPPSLTPEDNKIGFSGYNNSSL